MAVSFDAQSNADPRSLTKFLLDKRYAHLPSRFVSYILGKDAWRDCPETNGATSSACHAGDLSKVFKLFSSSLPFVFLFFRGAKKLDRTATFPTKSNKTQASRSLQRTPKIIKMYLLTLLKLSRPALSS